MTVCPDCEGEGVIRGIACGPGGGCRPHHMDCVTCRGEGEITPDQAARRQAGLQLREERLARRVTLREEAKRLGISPKELSDREWGR